MNKIYKDELFAAIHETASSLNEIGLVNKQTMKKFDVMCLTKIEPLNGEKIKIIRKNQNVSQAVFAQYLNVSKNLISQWERDEKNPSGTALKLLFLVKKLGLGSIA